MGAAGSPGPRHRWGGLAWHGASVQVEREVAEVMGRVMEVARREEETEDYSTSLLLLGEQVAALYRLVGHPFRGLVVPEQVHRPLPPSFSSLPTVGL